MLVSQMSFDRRTEVHRCPMTPHASDRPSLPRSPAFSVGKDCLLDSTSRAYAYGDLRDNLLTSSAHPSDGLISTPTSAAPRDRC